MPAGSVPGASVPPPNPLVAPCDWKKRRQVFKDHNAGSHHTQADQRAELAEARQPAEVQHQKRGNRRHRRPENARRNGSAHFRHGKFRVRQRLLVMHHRVIHRQAQQDRREAHADAR